MLFWDLQLHWICVPVNLWIICLLVGVNQLCLWFWLLSSDQDNLICDCLIHSLQNMNQCLNNHSIYCSNGSLNKTCVFFLISFSLYYCSGLICLYCFISRLGYQSTRIHVTGLHNQEKVTIFLHYYQRKYVFTLQIHHYRSVKRGLRRGLAIWNKERYTSV